MTLKGSQPRRQLNLKSVFHIRDPYGAPEGFAVNEPL
jgi:hypothetical protein